MEKKFLVLVAIAIMLISSCKEPDNSVSAATKDLKYTPLTFVVIDVDDDGLDIISLEESKVKMDVDGSGHKLKMAWIAPDDAILFVDLMNVYTSKDIEERYRNLLGNGVANLAALDANNDMEITPEDLENNRNIPLITTFFDSNKNGTFERLEQAHARQFFKKFTKIDLANKLDFEQNDQNVKIIQKGKIEFNDMVRDYYVLRLLTE